MNFSNIIPEIKFNKNIKKNYKIIAIDGNIGAGKSTLTKFLSEYFSIKGNDVKALYENPPTGDLRDYYLGNKSIAFMLQKKFQEIRIDQLKKEIEKLENENENENIIKINPEKSLIIIDRSFYGNYAFALNHYLNSEISDDEFIILNEQLNEIKNKDLLPDHIIFINRKAEECFKFKNERAINYENSVSLDYLKKIGQMHKIIFDNIEDKSKITKINTYELTDKDIKNISIKIILNLIKEN